MLRVLFFAQPADRLDKTHEDIALLPETQVRAACLRCSGGVAVSGQGRWMRTGCRY